MWLVSTGAISGNLPFRLNPGEYMLGRSKKAHIVIKDLTVSKEHARLICTGQTLAIEDLKSRNGTFVNGKRLDRGNAETGDLIEFGAVKCRLSATAIATPADLETMSTFRVQPNAPTIDISGLTAAQREIVALILEGLDERQIAARTGRRPSTVHTHLKAIYEHFEVHSRAQLIVKIVRSRSQS